MLRALIVEDSQAKLQAVAGLMLESQYLSLDTIAYAADVRTAKQMLSANVFDLLVVDLAIPISIGEPVSDDAGYDLLEELFEERGTKMPAQIVGLTALEHLHERYVSLFARNGMTLLQYGESSDQWRLALLGKLRQTAAAVKARDSAEVGWGAYVGIVCALDTPELDAVRSLDWNWIEDHRPGDPLTYWTGHFFQRGIRRDAVAAACPRMGMSAAAITATRLIHAFRPQYLGMCGITAGVRGRVEIGDVVAGDPAWDWGMGKWELVEKSLTFKPSPHQLDIVPLIRSALVRLSRDEMRLGSIRSGQRGERPNTALRLHVAPIASGSAVIADQRMTDEISAQHRKLAAIEMETYGLYAAASEAALPAPSAFSIKGVSDFADAEKDDRWRWYAASVSALVMKSFVEEFLDA